VFIEQIERVLNEARKAVERDRTPEDKYRRAMKEAGRDKGSTQNEL
jgi:hypothetical protein